MCGLTGFLSGAGPTAQDLEATVRRMASTILHRGPDDEGLWIEAEHGLALGFRRLAILDLTEAGHQPMWSASRRYVMVFNGEVYNFEAIRRELVASGSAPTFRGHSDTEVMLAAFEAWGVEAAVRRFIGMFAVALWDRHERMLHLIRDRIGVKPMYYGFAGRTFLFGSELKALRAHPDFDGTIDREAVAAFLRDIYIPAPLTIHRGIRKQLPGTIVTLRAGEREVHTTTYWSVREAAERGAADPFRGTEEEAAVELETLLRDAVALRMISDVPLGVFLSGGIDSALVTSLMQAQASGPVKTFSIGFHEGGYDEASDAAAIARHLGTAHTEWYVTPQESLDVIPRLAEMFDEPFADSSAIPTYLVSAIARRDVTVALSGDGGDEAFGGYARYFMGEQILPKLRRIPAPVRQAMSRAVGSVSGATWDRAFAVAAPILPRTLRDRRPGERMHRVATILRARDADDVYFQIMRHWTGVVPGTEVPEPAPMRRQEWPALEHPIDRMMYFDQISYLPDDILVKVDRASMAASLEAREPLLDHRIIELAWRLPLAMKVRGGVGKYLLRKVLHRYVPQSLLDRPKTGFNVPIDAWLRGPLRGWAESLLSERALREEGLLEPAPIRKAWSDHLAGRGNWKHHLWAVLMLQAWVANRDRPPQSGAAGSQPAVVSSPSAG